MKNLLKECAWYNPYVARTNKMEGYELENIKIYSENGILLETGRGWFGSNNDLGDIEIPEIILKRKIDLNSKQNFVIKDVKSKYRIDHKYTLYIYYKNINCNFIKFDLSSFWLESVFTILNGYEIRDVLGQRQKESDAIKYDDKLQKAIEQLDTYNFEQHWNEMEKNLNYIKKMHKKYIDKKEEEKNYTTADYKKMLFTPDEGTTPEEMIANIEKTFNVNIEEV
jgi:hypothetical protein